MIRAFFVFKRFGTLRQEKAGRRGDIDIGWACDMLICS
jgi:hypothetical protein